MATKDDVLQEIETIKNDFANIATSLKDSVTGLIARLQGHVDEGTTPTQEDLSDVLSELQGIDSQINQLPVTTGIAQVPPAPPGTPTE